MTNTEARRIWRKNNRERDNATARAWRLKNPERFKANQRRSRLKNHIKIREGYNRWLASLNPETLREMRRKYRLKWMAKHPEKYKAHYLEGYDRDRSRAAFLKRKASNPGKVKLIASKATSAYRARQRSATIGDLTDIAKVYDRCQWWRQWFAAEVDHVISLAKGGTHEAKNLQIIYDFENRRKSARSDYKPRVIFK